MEKKWIASAALVAVSFGFGNMVLAQSSVTIYGLADAGIGKAKSDGDRRVHMITNSTMNNSASLIGVRGEEDLGGGLRGGFNFEASLALSDGGADPNFWQRSANIWIGGNWGTFKMGRSWSPADEAQGAWELTGLANYNLTENMFWDVGTDFNNSSSFGYKTPTWGGFNAEFAYVFKDDHQRFDGSYDNRAKWDLNVIYDNAPIVVAIDINKQAQKKANYGIGAKYDFGQFAVAASFVNARTFEARYQSVSGVDRYGSRRGFTLGAQANFDAFTVTLDLGHDLKNVEWDGAQFIKSKKHTNVLLEGKYNLSKRTFMYAAYLRLDKTNNYGIGLQHSF